MSLENLFSLDLFSFSPLAWLAAAFAGLFFILVVIYSLNFMKGRKGLFRYYLYTVLTLVLTLGVIFADNLLLLVILWGFLGLLLYLLIGFGRTPSTPATARKALLIVGGTDAMMLLGLALVWFLVYGPGTGLSGLAKLSFSTVTIPVAGGLSVAAFLLLASAALAKAGAMPFHTWVPDMAEDAPIPVTAYLPASLDKLLGVFFLARISLELFILDSTLGIVLMALGSITIMAAVMMAMVQHDMKRLLGYHAVSQVGYMVLGIGTGNPIGICGALFHMFNHTIYKSCLFMAAGAVEKSMNTTDLHRLGGLAKLMPLVFGAFFVASLSISGVPPFNGFASKWMIYQGIIGTAGNGWTWIIWLTAAMMGSALTLASFMKLIHAVFLGQASPHVTKIAESSRPGTPFALAAPIAVLAVLCILFGVFADRIPFGELFSPVLAGEPVFPGLWSSTSATILILAGLFLGMVVYLLGSAGKTRSVAPFIGGEDLDARPSMRVSGVDFYSTVKDVKPLGVLFDWAERKHFDCYVVGLRFADFLGGILSGLHNGLLGRYVLWCLAGVVALYLALIG